FLRHLHLGNKPGYKMNQRAFGAAARANIRRVSIAAFECSRFLIQAEPTLLFFRPMAFQAMKLQQWPDIFLEIDAPCRSWRQFGGIDSRPLRALNENDHQEQGKRPACPYSNGSFHAAGQPIPLPSVFYIATS